MTHSEQAVTEVKRGDQDQEQREAARAAGQAEQMEGTWKSKYASASDDDKDRNDL